MMNVNREKIRKRFSVIVLFLCMFLLGGCQSLDAVAVQNGWRENPYYQEGDTQWDNGGIEEYYFNQLPSSLNEIYRELYQRIRDGEDESFIYASVDVDEFWTAYYAVLADHPELFWVGSNVEIQQSTLFGNVVNYKLGITVPPEEREQVRTTLEAAADECIAQIPEGASDYEKIKSVYEYLINIVDYDLRSPDNQNVQSALIYHRSVCAGYARAFQYILHRMGMFCTYVTGRITDGGEHGWNIVRIGDQYYHVDVTWGDPVFAGAEDGNDVRTISYNYLCCTDEELERTHVVESEVEMPPCTDDSLNYYKLAGMYYEWFDPEEINQALMNSVWNDQDSVTMKFADEDGFLQAREALFSDGLVSDAAQYLMEVYGMNSWNYSYIADEEFYLITIYWR